MSIVGIRLAELELRRAAEQDRYVNDVNSTEHWTWNIYICKMSAASTQQSNTTTHAKKISAFAYSYGKTNRVSMLTEWMNWWFNGVNKWWISTEIVAQLKSRTIKDSKNHTFCLRQHRDNGAHNNNVTNHLTCSNRFFSFCLYKCQSQYSSQRVLSSCQHTTPLSYYSYTLSNLIKQRLSFQFFHLFTFFFFPPIVWSRYALTLLLYFMN